LILLLLTNTGWTQLKNIALAKINTLEKLMHEARSKSIDITREEALLWFSKEFIKFADWDAAHKGTIERLFGAYLPYRENKAKYAEELPDFERQKVIDMLDKGIETLKKVINGSIKRRPVPELDWGNIDVGDNMFLCNGRPVFLYDYFSKSVGIPLTDSSVYNDYLGAIYHGGSRLYKVDQDRAVNPFLLKKDRTFDEGKLELIREIPNINIGFLLFWNSGVPEWILEEEPEVTKGRSLFTGFDIDNPLMRDVWSQIIRKVAQMTKGKKYIQLGFIFSNEPHWFSVEGHWTHRFKEMNSISSYTLNKFRNWLAKKYDNNIDSLNYNWQSQFNDFSKVVIKIPFPKSTRGTPIWYDWCRFNMDRTIDWFSFLQQELKNVNPHANTHIKIMPRLFTVNSRSHGIDFEALTELTTMIGDDAQTRGGRNIVTNKPEAWEEKYSYFWQELSFSYDFLESVAPDKIHVNSEVHFISTSRWRDLNTSPDYVRSCYWLATLQGMDAGLTWFWARDPDGSPEDRLEGDLNFFDPALAGSYAGSANMQPQTVNEITQVMMDLNSFSEEIIALRQQRRPVRIFYSETSAINKHHYMTELTKLYESMYFEGFPLGFATERIIKKQDNNNWDLIIVYNTDFVTEAEFKALQSYLNSGGTVLIDNQSLKKNEYGHLREKQLRQSNGTLIKIEEPIQISELKKKALSLISKKLPEVILEEFSGQNFKTCTWRVVKNPNGEGFLMNIVNLGKKTARLKVGIRNGANAICTDMLTGRVLGSNFELKSNGVLLLEVKTEYNNN
ncbi:MAG: beta-galactosidase, partial [Caldisericaceae bacterium]|nr:beta-galactosidase [Caldisericaceae bacterium]